MTQKLIRFLKAFLAAGCLLAAFPLLASAADVTLQWDGGTPDPDGYNLYQRLSGHAYDYSNPVNSATITGTTYTVSGLTEGATYYFVVRVFVGTDESGDSNEVEYAVPVADPDSDGATNLQEYLRGTDPHVADPIAQAQGDIPFMPPWAMAVLAGVLVTAGLSNRTKK